MRNDNRARVAERVSVLPPEQSECVPMNRAIDFLDTEAIGIAASALDAAIERCRDIQDDGQELRLATARHIIGMMESGECDRNRLRRSAIEYIQTRFR